MMVTRLTLQRNGNQADVETHDEQCLSTESARSSKNYFLQMARRRKGPDAIIWGMKTAIWGLLLVAAAGWQAAAQVPTFDTSGNGLLNGTYYFREVAYEIQDQAADAGDALALYGTITFNGSGSYTGSATIVDAAQGSGILPISGTYSISASGYGLISHPYLSGTNIYGLPTAFSLQAAQRQVSTISSLPHNYPRLSPPSRLSRVPTRSPTSILTWRCSRAACTRSALCFR
jgi:hypothetical protein